MSKNKHVKKARASKEKTTLPLGIAVALKAFVLKIM